LTNQNRYLSAYQDDIFNVIERVFLRRNTFYQQLIT